MARFERGDEFVEVWLERPEAPDGGHRWPELKTRSGRVGDTPAPVGVALLVSHALVSGRDYRRFLCERLESGWSRVRDPSREAEVGELVDPALEAQLLADPGNAEIAMVYADWLQHREHPRGALIAVQVARAARPDDEALAAEEQALLLDHEDVLLGPLAALVDEVEPAIELNWEHGFVRRVRLLRMPFGASEADVLWEVLRHPSARFLRELEVGCVLAGDQNNTAISATLINGGPRPPLRSLWLADFDDTQIDNIDISRAPIGDLRGLGQTYPLLESVILKGTGDVRLDGLDLPRAKKFALRTSTMTQATLQEILLAPWPVLEDLELWFGDLDRGYGAECTLADITTLFTRPLPSLIALRLMNAPFSDELVPLILGWRGAAQLTTLEFSLGTLSDAGARELALGRAALPALERLGVFECSLTPAGLAVLAEAGFPVDANQISKCRSSRGQKPGRYTSVNE